MKQAVMTFVKGMNTDLDNSVLSQGMYRHAVNLRLGNQVSSASGKVGSIENVQGNIIITSNPLTSGTIIGQVNVRDYIVLFVKHDTFDAVYKVLLNTDGTSVSEFELVYSDELSTSKLGFSLDNKIIAIGRHETSELNKVYWVDGLNPIRYLDLNRDYLTVQVEANILDIVPPYTISAPIVTDIVDGGNYTAGVVQYAYQLYTKNGASTAYSPLSNLVKLSNKTQFAEGGSEKGEDTGKAVRIEIPAEGYDDRYDRIRVIAIHYTSLTDIPNINIVGEYQNTEEFSFIDTGRVLSTLTIEEFTSFAETTYIPRTIESKDNHLFAGNIKESPFNSEVLDNWDSRAYRFSASDSTTIKLSDLIVVNDDYVLFNKTLVVRSTPLAGITGSSTWQDFWFYSDNKIYIVVPVDFSSGAIAYTSNEDIVANTTVQSVFVYNEYTELLSFGGRTIASVGDIIEEDYFGFPVDWNKILWNSPEGTSSNSTAKIYTSAGAMHLITAGDIIDDEDTWGVPTIHDAINYYNKIEPSDEELYLYQSNGTTVGGEGPNVAYSFIYYSETIDNTLTDPLKIGVQKSSLSVSTEVSVSGQAGETYRIGIGFYNKQGQCSFIKWVGDIKFPEYYDINSLHGFTTISESENRLTATKILLNINIKNFPVDSSIQGWQVFRVERTKNDRSIVYSGVISPTVRRRYSSANTLIEDFSRPITFVDGESYCPMYPMSKGGISFNPSINYSFVADESMDRTIEFHSPDMNFFKPSLELEGLSLKVGYVISQTSSNLVVTDTDHVVAFSKLAETECLVQNRLTPDATTRRTLSYDIEGYKFVSPVYEESKELTLVGSNQYKNQTFLHGRSDVFAGRGSGAIFYLNRGLYDRLNYYTYNYYGSDSGKYQYLYGRILRDVSLTRYGGITYAARNNNEYVPYSTYSPIDTTSVDCAYGDTYITMFQYMRGLWWDTVSDGKQSMQETLIFPCESSIDLRYRLDELYKYLSNGTGWTLTGLTLNTMTPQETVEKGIQLQPDTYDPSIGDLYRYNSVYSTEPNVKKYYPKPFDFTEVEDNDVKIIVSEKKYNGEYIDSWTVFKPANFIEVDTKYGPISTLRHFNGRLLFWQDRAFGTLSVNERSLIADNNPGQLSLGTGGVLERYDYSSTEIGCTNHFSLTNSDSALYWYDEINHQLIELSDRIKYLDLEKGIKSYIRNLSISDQVLVEVDKYNKEVIFAFPDNNVLVYNQLIEAFLGTHTYQPYMMFRDYRDRLFTVPQNVKYSVYKHNSSDVTRGMFYGVISDSEIDLIFNEDYDSIKVLDNLIFPCKTTSNGIDIFDDTFDTLQVYNSYQNTGEYDLVKGGTYSTTVLPLERRERMWSTFIPRNALQISVSSNPDILSTSNLNKSNTFKERIRDNYAIIKLKYSNEEGNHLSVPYVKILYRNSIR